MKLNLSFIESKQQRNLCIHLIIMYCIFIPLTIVGGIGQTQYQNMMDEYSIVDEKSTKKYDVISFKGTDGSTYLLEFKVTDYEGDPAVVRGKLTIWANNVSKEEIYSEEFEDSDKPDEGESSEDVTLYFTYDFKIKKSQKYYVEIEIERGDDWTLKIYEDAPSDLVEYRTRYNAFFLIGMIGILLGILPWIFVFVRPSGEAQLEKPKISEKMAVMEYKNGLEKFKILEKKPQVNKTHQRRMRPAIHIISLACCIYAIFFIINSVVLWFDYSVAIMFFGLFCICETIVYCYYLIRDIEKHPSKKRQFKRQFKQEIQAKVFKILKNLKIKYHVEARNILNPGKGVIFDESLKTEEQKEIGKLIENARAVAYYKTDVKVYLGYIIIPMLEIFVAPIALIGINPKSLFWISLGIVLIVIFGFFLIWGLWKVIQGTKISWQAYAVMGSYIPTADEARAAYYHARARTRR